MSTTLDEIREWFARRQEWNQKDGRWYHPTWHKRGSGQKRHPIPATLDAIAGLMPPGWRWTREWRGSTSYPKLKWYASRNVSYSWSTSFWIDDTGDEIRDRGLLALLAQQAEDKHKEPRP